MRKSRFTEDQIVRLQQCKHDKFIVTDFNLPSAKVYTGSSNLSPTAETKTLATTVRPGCSKRRGSVVCRPACAGTLRPPPDSVLQTDPNGSAIGKSAAV